MMRFTVMKSGQMATVLREDRNEMKPVCVIHNVAPGGTDFASLGAHIIAEAFNSGIGEFTDVRDALRQYRERNAHDDG
jgi:hypothetical protein